MTRDDPTPDDYDGEETAPEVERDADDGGADANDLDDTEDSDIADDPDIPDESRPDESDFPDDSDLSDDSDIGNDLDIPDDPAVEEATSEADRSGRRPATEADSTDSDPFAVHSADEPGSASDPSADDGMASVTDPTPSPEGGGSGGSSSQGLFDDLLSGDPIFENKDVLRPSYTPERLPHRNEQINNMATILVGALRGETPSNILIYGKTGTGKTASAKFVSNELETTSQKYDVPCEVEYINCEVTDTQYRVLAQLANTFIEANQRHVETRLDEVRDLADRAETDPAALDGTEFDTVDDVGDRVEELEADLAEFEPVPMTGWPTDRVYATFFDAVDYRERVVVIMLDEIDKLVEKSGDDTLYNLSRMNSELDNSRVSIMGISNDLKFTEFLDPRVKSSLGEEEIVFPPYDATQLRDILAARATLAFVDDALSEDVIPLCAAFAAQEHGDARRALDLLRTAGELAERSQTDRVDEDHVREAQEKIEIDRVVEVVRTLPTQSKVVLFAVILLERKGAKNINTGEVYNIYRRLCDEIDADVLTQRRVTDLISELDMLGIVNAVVVSKGRYGRTKEMNLSVPIEDTEAVLTSDSRLGDIEDVKPFVQARFDN